MKWIRRVGVLVSGLPVLGLLATTGCESSLPGPIECEAMAFRAMGRSPEEAAHSPLVRRVSERLTRGCLTVPFDQEAMTCLERGQSVVGCADALAQRHPERRSALQSLARELNQLGVGDR